MTRVCLAVVGVLALAACSTSEPNPPPEQRDERGVSAVLYTIGASSDPHGTSAPRGLGVATIGADRVDNVEVENAGLGGGEGATWIADDTILVPSTRALGRSTLFRYRGGRLERGDPLPFPRLAAFLAWSPDGTLVAWRPIERCETKRPLARCYRTADAIYVGRADGSGRRRVARASPSVGGAPGWTADGRLTFHEARTGDLVALDLESGERQTLLARTHVERFARAESVTLGEHAFSADGRYLAAFVYARWPRGADTAAFVVARSDGKLVRVHRSRLAISMLAWSPVGDRLAYTTSGFPTPHELVVVDRPGAKARRLLVTGRHFDWITWSPDGRRLLVDDEHTRRWRLVDASGREPARTLPRLGGRPVWCCPRATYAVRW